MYIPGRSPYRLLAYLSTQFQATTLVEIGVHNGWGSLALSYGGTNRIIGYDIDLSTLTPSIQVCDSCLEFRQGIAHQDDPATILAAPFIHFDAQHDGVYEKTFLDFLIANNYQGTVLWDDIHQNAAMQQFWDSIAEPKHDLTSIGHETGTGLKRFDGGEVQIVL